MEKKTLRRWQKKAKEKHLGFLVEQQRALGRFKIFVFLKNA